MFPFEKCARCTLLHPRSLGPYERGATMGRVRLRSHQAGLAQLAEHTQGGARTEFGCPHAPLWAVWGASIFMFPFLARQLSFWRWHPLRAGDRGAASCGASVPTQPLSAINGSLRLPARGLPAAGRVAEVSVPARLREVWPPGACGAFPGVSAAFQSGWEPWVPGRIW